MSDFEFQKYIQHPRKCLCVCMGGIYKPIGSSQSAKPENITPSIQIPRLGYMLINPPIDMLSNQEMHSLAQAV